MAKHRACTAVDCHVCGKTISRKADLARHMKTHATNKEELMLACNYFGCTYKTLQRSNLATHQNIHSGERPNKCPEDDCDFSTSDPGSLTRHRKEVHGYEPRAGSGSRASAIARKAARQRRRVSPYTSSSATSPSTSTRSVSPSGTSSPRLQTSKVLDQSPPSLLLTNDHEKNGAKNTAVAYSAELVAKVAQVDNPRPGSPNPEPENSLPAIAGSLTAPAAPTSQSPQLPAPEQETFYAADVPAQLVRDDFEDFLSQFERWNAEATPGYSLPSLPVPLAQHTVDDVLLPTPAPLATPSVQYTVGNTLVHAPVPLPARSVQYTVEDLLVPSPTPLPVPSVQYTVDDLLVPTPAPLPSYDFQYLNNLVMPPPTPIPSYEVQETTNNAMYSYPTNSSSFDAQFSHPQSFSAPDMGFYPQAVDQTHLYPAPAAASGFPMHETYLY